MVYELIHCTAHGVVSTAQPNFYGLNFHCTKCFIEIQLAEVGCFRWENPCLEFCYNAQLPFSPLWVKAAWSTSPVLQLKECRTEVTRMVALIWTEEHHFKFGLTLSRKGRVKTPSCSHRVQHLWALVPIPSHTKTLFWRLSNYLTCSKHSIATVHRKLTSKTDWTLSSHLLCPLFLHPSPLHTSYQGEKNGTFIISQNGDSSIKIWQTLSWKDNPFKCLALQRASHKVSSKGFAFVMA